MDDNDHHLGVDDISSAAPRGPRDALSEDQRFARAVQRVDVVVDVNSVPMASGIRVEPAKLLQAAKIIQDVLDTHGDLVLRRLAGLTVDAPGRDRVSTEAAQAWNARLVSDHDSFAHRVREYLRSLGNLVDNLTETARQYGYNEEQIRAAMQRLGTVPGTGNWSGAGTGPTVRRRALGTANFRT